MQTTGKTINVIDWVDKAKFDPVKHRQRQLTEILLHAIAFTPLLNESLYLKGGILMNLVYESPRATGDVDFTTTADPEELSARIAEVLDTGLTRASAALGYVDLVCRVQTVKEQPRNFTDSRFPALRVTIGSAQRGTNEEKRLEEGQAPQILQMDINFREPVEFLDRIILDETRQIESYSLVEIVAEKLRALLQQPVRNRNRRQDVYDLAFLIERFTLDADECAEVLRMLRLKAEARDIAPDRASLSDPKVAARARAEWGTMQQELEEPLPDFDERFSVVKTFYKSLPW